MVELSAHSDQFGILPSKEPLAKHPTEKTEIALKALKHINTDDIIALDGGDHAGDCPQAGGCASDGHYERCVYHQRIGNQESYPFGRSGGYRVRICSQALKVYRMYHS